MHQSSMTDNQLSELIELLELAKVTEKKAKDLADFILEIDHKYEQRLAEIRLTRKLNAKGIG